MKTAVLISAFPFFTAASVLFAAKEEGWNPDTKFPPLTPAEAIKTIEVPKGYRLECIASEPMVEEPASFAFDGNGALYVCEWRTYMQDEHGTKQLDPVSRIVKLTDTNGDGIMDQRTVFIDNVVLPRTVLPLHDRVLVMFTGSNSVWAYFDDNKDGVADRRELVFEGGANGGNIEHQNSGMLWNLDNTICTNDYRFTVRDGKLTAARHALARISQWGLAHDDDGRLIGTWAGGANPAHSFQLPAGYPILKINEHANGYKIPYASCKVWDQSSGGYKTDEQRVLRDFSACCGQSVLRSPLMPEFYGRVATCEPVGRLIRMSTIDWKDGLGVADNSFPKSEFIRSTDAYFRPVWSASAPDGTFVFSDLYRGIIQEKAWFPTSGGHTEWVERYHRVKKWGMIEINRHGRIYRLVPEGRKPGPQPRMLDETPAQLVAHLANPNGWWRDTAQMLLVTRRDLSVVPALTTMAATHADANARIHALWTLQGLDALPKESIIAATKNAEPRVRRAAVQLAESWLGKGDADIAKTFAAMLTDADAQVRIQLFLAYRAAKMDVPAELTAKPNPIIAALLEKEKADSHVAVLGESAKQGQKIYETLCTTCHGPDGKGVKAADKMLAPAFADSEWFKRGGNVEALARVVLKGQTGPIAGVSYGEGFMLPLEQVYDDAQLASVLNFIGERWHNWKKPVAAADIARVRKEVAERKAPWTHEELEKRGRRAPTAPRSPAADHPSASVVVPAAEVTGELRPLNLSAAFTADTRKGLYGSEKATRDSLPFVKFGRVIANGVTFEIADPAKSASGKNVIVLKGGPEKAFSQTLPQRVEIPVGVAASRLHFLGGVAGWGGGPGGSTPAMTATLHFGGGATQVADLCAGREFVDYVRRVDTPGSEFADGIVSEHQVRTFAIPVQHAAVIEKLVLESAGNKIAATTVAITAEIGKPGASAPASLAPATAKPAAPAAEKPVPAKPKPAPAASGSTDKANAPMGQKFSEPKLANTLRVVLVGAGSSHDFPRFFLGTDAEILRAAGGIETAATPNLDEALTLLPQADVLVLSGNHRQFGTPQFQDALKKFADAGKGVVVLHAGTWRNWPPDTGFNRRFVGGGAKSHGHGEFAVTVKPSQHPLLRGVPATFKITDENYHAELDADAAVEVLAENAPDKGGAHPSVWIVKDPKTRIACITLGHAAEAHENPAFKTLLTNAVKWAGAR